MRFYTILALAAATCLAQTSSTTPPAPKFAELQTYLGLSDAQVQNIQQMHEQLRTNTQAIRDQMRTKRTELRDLIQSGSTDATKIGQLQVDMTNLRKQLQDARGSLHDQVLTVLNPDQKTKVDALAEAAKLRKEIRQAAAAGFLSPADIGAGPGAGPGPGGRKMGRGMGPGRGPGPNGAGPGPGPAGMGMGRRGPAPVQ